MKKYLPVFLVMLLAGGCAGVRDFVGQIGGDSSDQGSQQSSAASAQQQVNDARESFAQKLREAQGRPVAEVRQNWGGLEPGLKSGGLTIYKWTQTAQITAPAGVAVPASSSGDTNTASCLAMFIVAPGDVVVDSNSEGQCLDYSKMPDWNPTITQSTDGRTGPVF
jgi:hypothetical protein